MTPSVQVRELVKGASPAFDLLRLDELGVPAPTAAAEVVLAPPAHGVNGAGVMRQVEAPAH